MFSWLLRYYNLDNNLVGAQQDSEIYAKAKPNPDLSFLGEFFPKCVLLLW